MTPNPMNDDPTNSVIYRQPAGDKATEERGKAEKRCGHSQMPKYVQDQLELEAEAVNELKLKMKQEFMAKERAAEQEFLLKQKEIRTLISKSKQKISESGVYGITQKQRKTLQAGEDEVDMDVENEMEKIYREKQLRVESGIRRKSLRWRTSCAR